MKASSGLLATWLVCSGGALLAQDTRTVTEPKIPATCVKLSAQLTSPIDEADETKLDTDRIQKAMDGCTAHPGRRACERWRQDGAS